MQLEIFGKPLSNVISVTCVQSRGNAQEEILV
jgi:hypothetical protein